MSTMQIINMNLRSFVSFTSYLLLGHNDGFDLWEMDGATYGTRTDTAAFGDSVSYVDLKIDATAVGSSHNGSPYVHAWPLEDGVWGTTASNPASLPAGYRNCCTWNRAGTVFVAGGGGSASERLDIYPMTGTVFGTKTSGPALSLKSSNAFFLSLISIDPSIFPTLYFSDNELNR